MNNIKILIDNFEQLKKNKFIIESIDPEFFFKFGENLIQENKELKEKIEEYEKQLDLDYVEGNYILKSALQELLDIDEIDIVHCRLKRLLGDDN